MIYYETVLRNSRRRLAVLPCPLGVRLRDASQDNVSSRRDIGDLQRWHSACHAEVLNLARARRSGDESVDSDSLSAESASGYALALLVGRLVAIAGNKTP